jgi:hypothetical protein
MYEEPNDENDENRSERATTPAQQAREKADEFRVHAELVAVFEGVRKFDAQLKPTLDFDLARDVQRTVAKLEKAKLPDTPVIDPASAPEAERVLTLPDTGDNLSTNDYYIHRRPGETMIVRWLAGDEVDAFYTRLQAHFDAALTAFREEEKHATAWKQDPAALKYLEALEAVKLDMAERYLREIIRKHGAFVLSTQTADEMNIEYLCDLAMGVDTASVVGAASAPPEDGATDSDRAWFFKLFSLRGVVGEVERMCFFAYLQKAEETW